MTLGGFLMLAEKAIRARCVLSRHSANKTVHKTVFMGCASRCAR